MLRRLNPRDVLELHLVDRIIDSSWRQRRLKAAEARVFASLKSQMQLRDKRKVEERYPYGRYELQQRKDLIQQDLVVMAEVREQYGPHVLLADGLEDPKLARLERIERHLDNTILRCMKELRTLQAETLMERPCEFTQVLLGEEEVEDQPVQIDETKPKSSEAAGAAGDGGSVPQQHAQPKPAATAPMPPKKPVSPAVLQAAAAVVLKSS